MASENYVSLIGNLGIDPEGFLTKTSLQGCRFRLCTKELWTDRDGNHKESVQWHHIVAFGRIASACLDRVRKGGLIRVQSRLQYSTYLDRHRVKRQSIQIVAKGVQFLDLPNEDYDHQKDSQVIEAQVQSAA